MRPPSHSARHWLPLPEDLAGLDPSGALERLRGLHAPWLLESALLRPGVGRFSFAGADPYAVLRSRGTGLEWQLRRRVHGKAEPRTWTETGHLLDALRRALPPAPPGPVDIPFCGGAVGLFGYELAEQLDVHEFHGEDDLGLPESVWLFVDALVAFDAETGRAGISGLGMASDPSRARRRARVAAERLLARLRAGAGRATGAPAQAAATRAVDESPAQLDVAAYLKAVDRVKGEIAAGELYQACLTYRVDTPFDGDPWQLYRVLRQRDPAPFAAYLELPELALACSSPERFLCVGADGSVETRPIKGTALRGADPLEDAARRAALAASPKDRAENVMIVDLARNDLGRVCENGSVHVPTLFATEPCAAVHHLVSVVRGRLRWGCDALDAVGACFPPGSMTGAPKIAAMRLLDRLEPHRRGFYAGALGYLDVRGGADLSVVIRTAFLRDGRAHLHTGGGIVADSEPTAEYRETLDKLRSLRAALDAT